METALLLSSRGSGGLGRVQLGLGLGPPHPERAREQIKSKPSAGRLSVCLSREIHSSWLAGSQADLPGLGRGAGCLFLVVGLWLLL